MSADNKKMLTDSVDLMINQKSIHKDMADVCKSAHNEFNIDVKHIYALKDYVHYYKNDWAEGNPLVPEKDVKWRCRLAPAFRRLLKVVTDLRETGRLDLLEPIIEALEDNGIHLQVDDTVNFGSKDQLMAYINAMDSYQSAICNLADERTAKRDVLVECGDTTKKSFNEYVKLLTKYKSSQNRNDAKDKVEDSLQDLVLDVNIDSSIYSEIKKEIDEVN